MCVYNPIRLEWHLGVELSIKPRRVLCGLDRQQASLLTQFNRLAVALAKSQDHRASCGVFSFGSDRLTHVTLQGLHGLTSQSTPHTSTPLVKKATSVGLATGKAHGTSVVNKAMCISEQTRQAHLGLFVFQQSIGVNMNTTKSGEGRIDSGLSTLGEPMSKRK